MTSPSLELDIGGSTRTAYLIPNSVRWNDQLDARTTLSFTLKIPSSDNYRPQVGNEVYLLNSASTIFGGQLDTFSETRIQGSSRNEYQCQCVDFTQICGRRLVYKSYTSSGYDADIIADINTNFLDGENITGTAVSTGLTIPELNFNYVTVTEAYNKIAKLTGRSWYIDPAKDIHYFKRETNYAPIQILSTSDNWRKLTVRKDRSKYRNREYLQGIFNTTSAFESFYGNNAQQSFSLKYPVISQPTITLGTASSTACSVGIGNVTLSSDAQWFWNKESNIIFQASSDTPLSTSASYRLNISYNGIYPIIAKSQMDEEIDARKTIEGGTGYYEMTDSETKVYTPEQSLASADALISKYGKMPEKISFETDYDGLKAGQLIWIELSDYNTNDYYYITNVSAVDIDMATLRYNVQAVSGQDRGGWVSFFKSLTKDSINAGYETPFSNYPVLYARKFIGNIKLVDNGASYVSVEVHGFYVDDPLAKVDTATCL